MNEYVYVCVSMRERKRERGMCACLCVYVSFQEGFRSENLNCVKNDIVVI